VHKQRDKDMHTDKETDPQRLLTLILETGNKATIINQQNTEKHDANVCVWKRENQDKRVSKVIDVHVLFVVLMLSIHRDEQATIEMV